MLSYLVQEAGHWAGWLASARSWVLYTHRSPLELPWCHCPVVPAVWGDEGCVYVGVGVSVGVAECEGMKNQMKGCCPSMYLFLPSWISSANTMNWPPTEGLAGSPAYRVWKFSTWEKFKISPLVASGLPI